MSAKILPSTGGLFAYQSSYNPALVAQLKARIPATDRKWDGNSKLWLVSPTYGQTLVDITKEYLGEDINLPAIQSVANSAPELKLFELHYVGATKPRDGFDTRSALGLDNQDSWPVLFPEDVLIQWFTGTKTDIQAASTLYGVLGIQRNADVAEVKSAYRRQARQWHPDICKEPDAAQRFRDIQSAYELLSNERKRQRYDAGLALEETLGHHQKHQPAFDLITTRYRPPLRCGYVLISGIQTVKYFVAQEILEWQDITRNGKTLVTSWPVGAKQPVRSWV